MKPGSFAFIALFCSHCALACDRDAAREQMSERTFEEAHASFVDCDVSSLSGSELGQFAWATLMTATDSNYSDAVSVARDLFERSARKGNIDSVLMLADILRGDADGGFPAEPLRARCLEAVAERAGTRRSANIGAVEQCLADRDCSIIDERLVFCPSVASPLATELGEAMALLEYTIQPSGVVSDIEVVEELGDTRWTDEAIAALSQWQFKEIGWPTRETHRFSILFEPD
jgi:hypothetical protein